MYLGSFKWNISGPPLRDDSTPVDLGVFTDSYQIAIGDSGLEGVSKCIFSTARVFLSFLWLPAISAITLANLASPLKTRPSLHGTAYQNAHTIACRSFHFPLHHLYSFLDISCFCDAFLLHSTKLISAQNLFHIWLKGYMHSAECTKCTKN